MDEPVHGGVHRWRYALVEKPLGESYIWDATLRLGACGDWCLGPRIEAAFNSGEAARKRADRQPLTGPQGLGLHPDSSGFPFGAT